MESNQSKIKVLQMDMLSLASHSAHAKDSNAIPNKTLEYSMADQYLYERAEELCDELINDVAIVVNQLNIPELNRIIPNKLVCKCSGFNSWIFTNTEKLLLLRESDALFLWDYDKIELEKRLIDIINICFQKRLNDIHQDILSIRNELTPGEDGKEWYLWWMLKVLYDVDNYADVYHKIQDYDNILSDFIYKNSDKICQREIEKIVCYVNSMNFVELENILPNCTFCDCPDFPSTLFSNTEKLLLYREEYAIFEDTIDRDNIESKLKEFIEKYCDTSLSNDDLSILYTRNALTQGQGGWDWHVCWLYEALFDYDDHIQLFDKVNDYAYQNNNEEDDY